MTRLYKALTASYVLYSSISIVLPSLGKRRIMSCLVEKFSYYIDLDETERRQLELLEKSDQHYKKGNIVYDQDTRTENIYVVKSGWLISYSHLNDGGRLVMNIHFPGDIVGIHSIPFEKSADGLMAIKPATLCPFPKSGLRDVFTRTPRLAALIFAAGMQDHIVLHDRLKAIGRMAGENRIALLLLQIQARLKITNPNTTDSFEMPLSQEIIGDALGITPVYVNRMLRQLQNDGWISYQKPSLTLLNSKGLKIRCDFKDRYYQLDTEWLKSNQKH